MKKKLLCLALIMAAVTGWSAYQRDQAAKAEATLWAEATDTLP